MLNWICGIFAVLLALVVSSLELLTKYEAKKFREIFGSPYYWAGFVPPNVVFSAAVYWALPHLSKLVLTSSLTTNLENPVLGGKARVFLRSGYLCRGCNSCATSAVCVKIMAGGDCYALSISRYGPLS